MLSDKAARSVEALHILVLVVFVGFMPFVFQAMPQETVSPAVPSKAGDSLERPLPETPATARSSAEAAANAVIALLMADSVPSPREGDDEKGTAAPVCIAHSDKAPSTDDVGLAEVATGDLEPRGTGADVLQKKKKQCSIEAPSRLSLLPFLVAFIGGGVFSLEAFEAFPML
eukprot:gnl/TRDRNA2_/TRDRNA2_43986_c0_seq1.p1 gnl/TRDRNA2_/TRDRNA2_43986_c0~~gnl/TRDRNA2_/TRDRNA2_43986_c0_seq1.p1  ORF type:complete len:172 (-),score=35.85 gnl/TRDRNA2_/TRDRNA2_43986_c0_seq1:379-894(-)